ncbi:MAG: glycosyltransferase [Bacteroidota bacterium]
MKILCITSRVPWPLEKGDKLRAYHQLKRLSARHQVILFALTDTPVHPDAETELRKFCSEVYVHRHGKIRSLMNLAGGLFSRLPFQVAYFTSGSGLKAVKRFHQTHRPDAVYCQLIRTAEYRKQLPVKVPSVIDYMDVFSKGVERRIPNVPFLLRWLFRMEWKRLLAYERDVFPYFSGHTVISSQDRDLLPVADLSHIAVVPNGVDTDFFSADSGAVKEFDLLFNGNMNYPPNVESVVFVVKEVMPLVWEKRPGTRLLISGANPSPAVKALAGEKVVVTGWVDDVRDSFNRSRLLIAPMKSSIGLQNKLLEAMAMGLPCITTELSNNALGAKPGEEIIVADTAAAFAESALRMLNDPAEASRIADKALAMVKRRYDWEAFGLQLEAVLKG